MYSLTCPNCGEEMTYTEDEDGRDTTSCACENKDYEDWDDDYDFGYSYETMRVQRVTWRQRLRYLWGMWRWNRLPKEKRARDDIPF